MRRFLVQAVIDGLIAAAIVFVLSLIHITQPFPFGPARLPIVQPSRQWRPGLFVWGVVFALVNRVVRPALVALFGRWLFSTLGLFVVVITAFTLLARLAALAGGDRGGRRPELPLAPLVAASSPSPLVADIFLGLSRPDVGVPGPRSVWTFLESLPTPRRNAFIENLRLQQVYEALYQDEHRHRLRGHAGRRLSSLVRAHILGEVRLTDDESAPNGWRPSCSSSGRPT